LSPKTLREASRRIELARRVLIAAHIQPDADALGSLLGLALALEGRGARVIRYGADPVPPYLQFLPGANRIVSQLPPRLPELVIVLDCDGMDRVGPQWERLLAAREVIRLDHHVTGEDRGEFIVADPAASSASEVVGRLLRAMKIPPTPEIATCLYAGMLMDSGRFGYSNTTAATLRMAASLVDAGADPWRTARRLYEAKTEAQVRLLGWALSHLGREDEGRIVWSAVPQGVFSRIGAQKADTEGIIDHLRAIQDIEVAMLLTETAEGQVRVSLRSRGTVDVAAVAAALGGGGHAQAAGCTVPGPLPAARRRLVAAVRQQRDAQTALRR
jgi:phosphoesterase RecJ-like protein